MPDLVLAPASTATTENVTAPRGQGREERRVLDSTQATSNTAIGDAGALE